MKSKLRNKILDYIKQLEKAYDIYMEAHYENNNGDIRKYYMLGKANAVRATINDLNDILNGITYSERLDKTL